MRTNFCRRPRGCRTRTADWYFGSGEADSYFGRLGALETRSRGDAEGATRIGEAGNSCGRSCRSNVIRGIPDASRKHGTSPWRAGEQTRARLRRRSRDLGRHCWCIGTARLYGGSLYQCNWGAKKTGRKVPVDCYKFRICWWSSRGSKDSVENQQRKAGFQTIGLCGACRIYFKNSRCKQRLLPWREYRSQ